MIDLVGFDGDDTLWHSQGYYDHAQAEFERILANYIDLADAGLLDALLATERGNLSLFGYGAKGMTLSMIESAIELTNGRIGAADIHRIVKLGKDVLSHPVELLPGIRDAVETVARTHRIVLITKGDLFHQEYKVARCGLADLFHRIEIVSEKNPAAYARVFREFDIAPERFAMVGNSLRSDIAPVVALGGWGIYMPYHSTWAHETETDFAVNERVIEVAGAEGIPDAVATMHATSER
ncbi:putative hydrolase of the HAD superfamily [Luteibacter rhizovicinus]|uniref:Putative hydrolase of the HAD superfamily n=1 Tax=Luteibacter rhizovicinus TaxID=242606 RepID=A0A4R3YX72_9GAMM|nr:HAD family hydrolase [Luteibacter rhizovicinus]TCV95913.1 putative hydrolase of the HAD superfamily [Luteibacter rhizovicinus]